MADLKTLIKDAAAAFSAAGIDCAESDAQLLALDAFSCDRLWLVLRGGEEITDGKGLALFEGYVKRRLSGEPVQYITGRASFMGMDLYVDGSVLVPRPETEVLAEAAAKDIASRLAAGAEEVRVLDLCTGSGCIALACAMTGAVSAGRAAGSPKSEDIFSSGNRVKVTAADISDAALDVAGRNARSYGLDVRFLRGDLYGALPEGETFDLLLSNPPYIPSAVIDGLQKEVRDYEPRLALDGGESGLDIIERILGGAAERLAPGGLLLMEIGDDQGEAALGLAGKARLAGSEVLSDLAGRPRVLRARKL